MACNSKTVVSWLAAIGWAVAAIPSVAQTPGIDFGNDNSEFANDGECDDLRFEGDGRAEIVLTDDIGRDASDCRNALAAETVSLDPLFIKPTIGSAIIFGDDTSEYARDGECDDIRFAHTGSAETIYLAEDVGHDATDCKAGFEAGSLTWQGHRADLERGVTADELIDESGGLPHPTT